jgi:ParB family chromosome partitioning protein
VSSRRKGGLGRGLAELLGGGGAGEPEEGDVRAPIDPQSAAAADVQAQLESGSTLESSLPRARVGTPERAGVTDLPIAGIRPNQRQPRREIDPAALEELARSIESVGMIQPIIVRSVGDTYELIAGERRWRAAQMAGYTVIPAIIREASDVESLELALVENVVREDLNVMDEAFALQVLLEDLDVTQETLAAQVGRSRSAIANKIRLLELPAPVQSMLTAGDLSEGHGRALLGLRSRGDQLRLARRAVRERLSVRQTEAAVRRASGKAEGDVDPRDADRIAVSDATLDALRDHVYGTLQVMPRVRLGKAGGVVELPFKDEAGLRELIDRLRNP